MPVATLFKRVVGLGAVSVARVEVTQRRGERGVEVEIARRRKKSGYPPLKGSNLLLKVCYLGSYVW